MQENIPIYLITRCLSGEASEKEKIELSEWLSESKANELLFNEHKDAWNSVRENEYFNLQSGLDRINSRIDSWEDAQPKNVSYRNILYKVAASVIVFVAVASLLYRTVFSSQSNDEVLAWQELKTDAGYQQNLSLPDSSHIKMNGLSVVSYPATFSTSKREVHLQGEAYFEVTKDEKRPFIIYTGDFTTQVVGTSFNIKTDSSAVVVSVTSGKVKVYINHDTVFLTPGNEVFYNKNNGELTVRKANLDGALAWLSNSLYVQDEPLIVVANKIHQLYGIESSFENERIRHCHITGKFTKMSIEDILHAIEFSTGTHYQLQNNTIYWTGNGCQ